VPTAVRQQVSERAHGCCEYCRCQADYATQPFSIEHILPRARGGTTTLNNLALACQGCNNHKYARIEARDPVSGHMAPLYNPRRDRWDKHFAWSEDYLSIIGLTPTGRATVAALFLHREGVVNLRRLLYMIGKHPPPTPAAEPSAG
jgi:hypothetical protein